MCSIYSIQFFVFSVCAHIFTIFTYIVFYSDVFTTFYLQENHIKPEYDYVIVGCGTAGSVIAHRLATETNYTFIVLEAGSRSHALLEMPVIGPFLHGSIFDWQYQTVPQEHACFGMKDRKCKLAQGKIVGGSSKLNNMIHIRGNLSQYSSWFHGKYNKNYLEKQFEFVEKNFLHINNVQYRSELSDAVLDAARELGYETLNKDFKSGFMKSRVSQKNGKRWSTADKLDTAQYVISNSLVEKIIFSGSTAVGLISTVSGYKTTIYARKGIILSAGALNTPKILQLSGVGPKKLLNSLGIPVVQDLLVGHNLQDHVGSGLDLVLFNKSVSINAMDMINPYHMAQYFVYGNGPWTTPGCEVVGLLSTKNSTQPDIEFMVLPAGISSDRGSLLKNHVNIKDSVWTKYFSQIFNSHALTILPVLLQPKSKGYVFINSTNPKNPLLIDPKYLSHDEDRKTLIDGLKLVMNFVNTNAIKNIGGSMNALPFPGCEQFEIFTDSYFDCYIKHLTLTTYHPIGTCAMGLPDSKNSVVDTSFRVIGVNNLYVADASVLPTMPSCNINAAVAMMASVFFDTNIAISNTALCYKTDGFYEYMLRICMKQ